jgi:hypothetical protein
MATPSGGYIAATIPASIDRESFTTLFHVAMFQFNDPLQWVPIARLNGLLDPWVFAQIDLLIPPVLPTGPIPPTGILGQ